MRLYTLNLYNFFICQSYFNFKKEWGKSYANHWGEKSRRHNKPHSVKKKMGAKESVFGSWSCGSSGSSGRAPASQ
jgi:hypothetical protein